MKGAAFRKQGYNESVEENSRDILLLLAKGNYSEKTQIQMYISNMRPQLSRTAAVDFPKTLAKARKYAIHAQLYYQNSGEKVHVNAMSMVNVTRQKLVECVIDSSTLSIAERTTTGREVK